MNFTFLLRLSLSLVAIVAILGEFIYDHGENEFLCS